MTIFRLREPCRSRVGRGRRVTPFWSHVRPERKLGISQRRSLRWTAYRLSHRRYKIHMNSGVYRARLTGKELVQDYTIQRAIWNKMGCTSRPGVIYCWLFRGHMCSSSMTKKLVTHAIAPSSRAPWLMLPSFPVGCGNVFGRDSSELQSQYWPQPSETSLCTV